MEINYGNRKSVTFQSSNYSLKINKLPRDHLKILQEMSTLKDDKILTAEEKRIKLKQILE